MSTAPKETGPIVRAEDVASRYALEHTKLQLDAGFLGRFFGSAANAPTNIAGLVLFVFTFTSVVLLFKKADMPTIEFLKLAIPVITLVLGYLFGKHT